MQPPCSPGQSSRTAGALLEVSRERWLAAGMRIPVKSIIGFSKTASLDPLGTEEVVPSCHDMQLILASTLPCRHLSPSLALVWQLEHLLACLDRARPVGRPNDSVLRSSSLRDR